MLRLYAKATTAFHKTVRPSNYTCATHVYTDSMKHCALWLSSVFTGTIVMVAYTSLNLALCLLNTDLTDSGWRVVLQQACHSGGS